MRKVPCNVAASLIHCSHLKGQQRCKSHSLQLAVYKPVLYVHTFGAQRLVYSVNERTRRGREIKSNTSDATRLAPPEVNKQRGCQSPMPNGALAPIDKLSAALCYNNPLRCPCVLLRALLLTERISCGLRACSAFWASRCTVSNWLEGALASAR